MSTFAEYKKKRPADPALVAQYKATMQYQLDRQRLAKLIADERDCWTPCEKCTHLADAILDRYELKEKP